jgi:3'-phosphoadenosine 5'-phosphosulfate sulfotransferase (PAPS reductase)/FAD synthetase
VTPLAEEVARAPLAALIQEAHGIVDGAMTRFIHDEQKKLTATYVLFSGGNDSTVLTHLMRNRANAAVHINTGIGIEQTREFVRATCKEWGLPLIEEYPPKGCDYRTLVLDQGFPGPGHHYKMYQRLKERALRNVRRGIVKRGRSERVMFLAGRRRQESQRRMNIPDLEREGSVIWVSPLVNWSALNITDYLSLHEIKRNEVAQLLHMSGECLCGAFAKPKELDEIALWFPEVARGIHELEEEVRKAGHQKCKWGWGAGGSRDNAMSGPLCSSCEGSVA